MPKAPIVKSSRQPRKRTSDPSVLALAALPLLLAATPAQAQSRFALVGDIGHSPGATAVSNMIKNQGVDHVLTSGDNCYGKEGLAKQIEPTYGNFVQFRRFWPSLGNHDYNDLCGNNARAYLAYFNLPNNERYYKVRLGSVDFIAVNSNLRESDGVSPTSKQGQYVRTQIKNSTAAWQIVYFHHPPYSSGASHGSTERMRWPFEEWGADAVINGHDHIYERILRDDDKNGKKLVYLISGLGGRETGKIGKAVEGSVIRYNAALGSVFLTASDSQLKFEFRNVNGTVIDSYTVTK